jgi:DNA-binding transcriptional ArsR family regulator
MNLIKSERSGRYLTYHANNIDSRTNRPPRLIPNNNAKRILEYLLRNPGARITNVTRALTMNRNTVSYHIKRLQTNGFVEKLQSNGLRLTITGGDYGQGLPHTMANHMPPGDVTVGSEVPSPLATIVDAKGPILLRNSLST